MPYLRTHQPAVRRLGGVVLGLLALLQPLAAHQPHDPIHVVAVSPDYAQDQTMFAGTGALTMPLPVAECAQMQSTNGGFTFSVMSGLPDQLVESIAFSPAYANDGTVFMAGRGGLYISRNRGTTWTAAGGALTTLLVAVAIAPNFSTSGAAFVLTPNAIYGSRDHGQSWQPLPNPSGITSGLTAIAISSNYAADATLLLGTAFIDVSRTTDAGHTWTPVTQGLTLSSVSGIAFSP